MYTGKYIFAQVMEYIPRYQFDLCVKRYEGEKHIRSFTCRHQFLVMAFGQFAYRESLRDVVTCLRTHRSTLYHLGMPSSIAKTTLAKANERRDWRIYRDFADVLITRARTLYRDEKRIMKNIENTCYALDASVIDLCLSQFQWAKFGRPEAAAKLHLLYDIDQQLPSFFCITKGNVSDVFMLDWITFEKDAFYIFDKGYHDFERFYKIYLSGAFFVTRAKKNTKLKRVYSRKVDKSTGVRSDQIVWTDGVNTREFYPEKLRRITFVDDEGRRYNFLTNNMEYDAHVIADLYKNRWQVELFFKWIKQHLRIKKFWGRSENAVKTQICIAISAYVLVAIMKKELKIDRSLYEILQILSISLLVRKPIDKAFLEDDLQFPEGESGKQQCLWEI